MSNTFESLYGYDVNGKMKKWSISVSRNDDNSVITIEYGYINGKMTASLQTISVGKNIGKKNKTTHYEQAMSISQSKWKKKCEEGYSTQTEKGNTQTDLNTQAKTKIVFPMLAQDFNKHKNKLVYPCYIQPKLDGFRNLYDTTTNKNTTRQGKEFSIIKQSGKLYKELLLLPKGLILDGELYSDKINFEELGVLRKTKCLTHEEQANLEKIEYHIYDIIDTSSTFEERNNRIKELHLENYEKLVYVPTFVIDSEKQIRENHNTFLEQGFEGSMVRNKNSFYTIKQRSRDLLKYKDFQDGEFEIIDFTFEKDTSAEDKNLIVWIVKVDNCNEFVKCKVRPMGTKEERRNLYEKCEKDFNQFKGRKLWVKYFEKTKDGNLRFPTTKCNSYTEYIRDEMI